MKLTEEGTSRFRAFADDLMKEQVAELERLSSDLLLSGKLARIRVYNSRQQILKQRLNEEIRLILDEFNPGDISLFKDLEHSLNTMYDEYVNELFLISFGEKGN